MLYTEYPEGLLVYISYTAGGLTGNGLHLTGSDTSSTSVAAYGRIIAYAAGLHVLANARTPVVPSVRGYFQIHVLSHRLGTCSLECRRLTLLLQP